MQSIISEEFLAEGLDIMELDFIPWEDRVRFLMQYVYSKITDDVLDAMFEEYLAEIQ